MRARADRRVIDEGPHRNVDEGALADQGIKERAALLAMGIVSGFVAVDHEAASPCSDAKLLAFDAGERLEGGTRRPPTV